MRSLAGERLSIVIPAHNEGVNVQQTMRAILADSDQPHEIIIVDDGSTDRSFEVLEVPVGAPIRVIRQARSGVAGARNRGAREATGDLLIFLDAHCELKPGCLQRLRDVVMAHPRAIVAPCILDSADESLRGYGVKITDRAFHYRWLPRRASGCYPVPVAGGACLAMTRDFFFHQLGAFDNMRSFGVEDVELCLRCWLFGFEVLLEPEAEVTHLFRPKGNYVASWVDYLHNALRTAALHFSGERLQRIVQDLEQRPDFAQAAGRLLTTDLFERHSFVSARHTRDADWFCRHFDVSL